MTGDGGLIALSLTDSDRLIGWGGTAREYDEDIWSADEEELLQRLIAWAARHSEATP